MPIFQLKAGKAETVKLSEFKLEKDLQKVIENNLQTIFNCKFIATEFPTGSVHSGRIDTLAISEDNNPVIIEYKKVASSELINQSLYYLHWMIDHKGDFQIAVNRLLGNIEIDWSAIRVICLAPEFKKYDLHAVQVMGANIELWQYKIYDNDVLSLEEVYKRTENISFNSGTSEDSRKNPIMVEAGRKAALTRQTAIYTIEEHLEILDDGLTKIFNELREYIFGLTNSIEENPKKNYIAYKTSQNFVCIVTSKDKLLLFLKVSPEDINPFPKQCRDVRGNQRFMAYDIEVTLKTIDDFNQTKELINSSLKNIGG